MRRFSPVRKRIHQRPKKRSVPPHLAGSAAGSLALFYLLFWEARFLRNELEETDGSAEKPSNVGNRLSRATYTSEIVYFHISTSRLLGTGLEKGCGIHRHDSMTAVTEGIIGAAVHITLQGSPRCT